MKYYPRQEDGGGWAAAERDYPISLQAIWGALPPDLRLLCDRTPGWSPGRIFLNDSSVKKVEANFEGKTVEIVLAGEALDEDGGDPPLARDIQTTSGTRSNCWGRGCSSIGCCSSRSGTSKCR